MPQAITRNPWYDVILFVYCYLIILQKANTENSVEIDDREVSARFTAEGDPANSDSASSESNPFLECAVPQLIYKTAVKGTFEC